MHNRCYAISKKNAVVIDLGPVKNMDWLYHFDSKRPVWSEPHEIIFDVLDMHKAWENEDDLWVVLSGTPPADDFNLKNHILKNIHKTLIPIVTILTVSQLHYGRN